MYHSLALLRETSLTSRSSLTPPPPLSRLRSQLPLAPSPQDYRRSPLPRARAHTHTHTHTHIGHRNRYVMKSMSVPYAETRLANLRNSRCVAITRKASGQAAPHLYAPSPPLRTAPRPHVRARHRKVCAALRQPPLSLSDESRATAAFAYDLIRRCARWNCLQQSCTKPFVAPSHCTPRRPIVVVCLSG